MDRPLNCSLTVGVVPLITVVILLSEPNRHGLENSLKSTFVVASSSGRQNGTLNYCAKYIDTRSRIRSQDYLADLAQLALPRTPKSQT